MNSNRRAKIFYFSFLLVIFILSGCLKQSSPVYYHTLASTSPADTTFVSPSNILLGPIRVASFLDQRQLVRQHSAHSLSLAEQHRWAGDLPEMITDVLHVNLSLDLGTEKIYDFPSRNNLEGLQLEIHFLHFEEDEKGQARLGARWKIISTENQMILHTKTSIYTIKIKTGNYDGLANGLSQGLALLSNEISKKLIGL